MKHETKKNFFNFLSNNQHEHNPFGLMVDKTESCRTEFCPDMSLLIFYILFLRFCFLS
ncbi:unnamed protein product [Meloidogyne enterolobii]|uniref:Uncharacterized protein n=1 Tax=Meloidogyne enterolobii TaxID=390850 RepID=A0ACB1APH7_MELEN